MRVTNYLLGYKDYKIIQDPSMFNFSLDSVLLPNFVSLNKKTNKILDIGCGNAPIPLILSTKTKANIIGIEIQKEVFEMALESVKMNHLDNQIEIINADINEYCNQINTDSFDTITCNPPFFKKIDTSKINKNDHKTIARHEVKLNLEQIIVIAKKLLKNKGNIALVHRPDRLIDIITIMKNNNIEPKRIQFIYPKIGQEANILLIEGTKNGKPGLKMEAPIYTHNIDGSYSEQIKKYFE